MVAREKAATNIVAETRRDRHCGEAKARANARTKWAEAAGVRTESQWLLLSVRLESLIVAIQLH